MRKAIYLSLGLYTALATAYSMAAEITEVLDAFEKNKPIDVRGSLEFTLDRQSAQITREYVDNGVRKDVRELDYTGSKTGFNLRIDLGVFRDLALFVVIPIHRGSSNGYEFAQDVGEDSIDVSSENSSLLNQDALELSSMEATEEQVRLIPQPPLTQKRGGFGDLQLGMRWGALSNEEDPYTAALAFQFMYTAPTGARINPSDGEESVSSGGISPSVHDLAFSIAMSRKLNNYVDPFIMVEYHLPVPAADSLILPQQWGGFKAGSDFHVFSDGQHSFSLGLHILTNYHAEAEADYSEVTDIVRRTSRIEQYASFGGGFDAYGEFFKYGFGGFSLDYVHDRPHLLTATYYGEDKINNETDARDGKISPNSNEFNPRFYRYFDEPGRRLRIENSGHWILAFRLGAQY
jgi:hypothetical protein